MRKFEVFCNGKYVDVFRLKTNFRNLYAILDFLDGQSDLFESLNDVVSMLAKIELISNELEDKR